MSRVRKFQFDWRRVPAKWYSIIAMLCMPWLHVSADITKNLVAHYALDEEAGLIANDSSGKENDGDLVGYESGNTGWTIGKIGGALSFDGTNDYVAVPHNSDFNLKTYTLSAWVNVSLGEEIRPILVKGKFDDGVNSTDVPFALYVSATKKLTLAYEKSASSQRYAENMSYEATGLGLTPGVIYHVAVTRNNSGGEVVFYVDGQSRGGFDSTPKPGDNKKNLYLGLDPKTNALFKGGLDDVRIYSQALQASDIQALYELGVTTQQSTSSNGEATVNENAKTDESQNNAEREEVSGNSAKDSSNSENTESGGGEEISGEDDSKNSNQGQSSSESGQNSNGNETTDTDSMNPGTSDKQTNTTTENSEANGSSRGEGEEEPSKEDEGLDDGARQNGSEGESQNTSAPSDPSGDGDDKSGNSNAPTQQNTATEENPETNGSDQNGKDSGDTSKEDDRGNASGKSDDSSKGNDSKSEKTSKGKDDTADMDGKGNGLSTDTKESGQQTEQETGYSINQFPTNVTLSKKSIYEGKPIGSIVGRFQVVDPDDPKGEGTYLIELVSNNSAARRAARSSYSTENPEQKRQEDKTSDSNARNEGKNEKNEDDGGATGKQSNEPGKNQEDEKTGGAQDSAKETDNGTESTKKTASSSSSSKGGEEKAVNSSYDTKVDSQSGWNSEETNSDGWFVIDGQGRLLTKQLLDYETRNSYSIRIRATDQGGLSVEKDFVIRVKDAFVPIIRTLGVSSKKAKKATIKGEILANGYSAISEAGIIISKQPRFKMGDKDTAIMRVGKISQRFELSLNGLDPETTYYFRSYAINGEGISYGSLDRFTTSKTNDGPWANMKPIGNGWLHSDWLGHFYPSANDWVYHEELGWLCANKTDTEGIWLYSEDFLGWFWTSPKVYPFVFAERSRNWAYYQGVLAQHRVFYHFGQNSWMAVSRDISTKKKQSKQASTGKKSSREESVSKQSTTSRETERDKSSKESVKQQR